jgi:hypothetical protein
MFFFMILLALASNSDRIVRDIHEYVAFVHAGQVGSNDELVCSLEHFDVRLPGPGMAKEPLHFIVEAPHQVERRSEQPRAGGGRRWKLLVPAIAAPS